MIWWIVRIKEPMLGIQDGNLQVMLNEEGNPVTYLSPASAVSWAESKGLSLDDPNICIVNRSTHEVYNDRVSSV